MKLQNYLLLLFVIANEQSYSPCTVDHTFTLYKINHSLSPGTGYIRLFH